MMKIVPKIPMILTNRDRKILNVVLIVMMLFMVVSVFYKIRHVNAISYKTTSGSTSYRIDDGNYDVSMYPSVSGVEVSGTDIYLLRTLSDAYTGLLFNLTIPSNATITSAYIEFQCTIGVDIEDNNYAVSVYTSMNDSITSWDYGALTSDLLTPSVVNIDLRNMTGVEQLYQTADISSVLNGYRNYHSVSSDTILYPIIILGAESDSIRHFRTYEYNSSLSPRIVVTYSYDVPMVSGQIYVDSVGDYHIYTGTVGFSGFIVSGQSYSGWELYYVDFSNITGDYEDADYAINNFTEPSSTFMDYDSHGVDKGIVYDSKLYVWAMDGSGAADNIDLYVINVTSEGIPYGSWSNVATIDTDRDDTWAVAYYNHTAHYVTVATNGLWYRNISLIDYSQGSMQTIHVGNGASSSQGCDIHVDSEGGLHVVGSLGTSGSSLRKVRYYYMPPDRSGWTNGQAIIGTGTMSHYPHITDWQDRLIIVYDDSTSHVEYRIADADSGVITWGSAIQIANAGYSAREVNFVKEGNRLYLQLVHDELVDKRNAYAYIDSNWNDVNADSLEPWNNNTSYDCEGTYAVPYNDDDGYYYFFINYQVDALAGWSDGMTHAHWVSMDYWDDGIVNPVRRRYLDDANGVADGVPNNPTSALGIVSTMEGLYYVYDKDGNLVDTYDTLDDALDGIHDESIDYMENWLVTNQDFFMFLIGFVVFVVGIGYGITVGGDEGFSIIVMSFMIGIGLMMILLGS